MITYKFNGETHVLSQHEYEAITETGRCDLELYIAPADDRVEAWWKAQLRRDRAVCRVREKVCRLVGHSKKNAIQRTKAQLEKEVAARLDKSPVIEVHNYTAKERKDAVKVPKTFTRGDGYKVRPRNNFPGPHAGNG